MEERSPGMEAKQQAQEDKQLAGDKVEDLKYWEGFFLSTDVLNQDVVNCLFIQFKHNLNLRRPSSSC